MFKKENLRPNIAQIFLSLIFLIVLCPILSFFLDKDSWKDIVDNIPGFELWVKILTTGNKLESNSLKLLYLHDFFSAIVMGICVHIFVKIAEMLNIQGLQIFPTVLGITAGILLTSIYGSEESFGFLLYVAIMLIGIMLMLKALFRKLKIFDVKDLLIIVIESILAVIMCGYIIALVLVRTGYIGFAMFFSITCLAIAALLIVSLVRYCMKKEEKEKDKKVNIWI